MSATLDRVTQVRLKNRNWNVGDYNKKVLDSFRIIVSLNSAPKESQPYSVG